MDFKWVVLLSVLGETLSQSNYKGCMKQNTYGYAYLELFSVDLLASPIPKRRVVDPRGHLYIEFYVKATDNAHIMLSNSKAAKLAYEIVLGGGNNTFSQIRLIKDRTKKSMKTVKTERIVSADELRGFWIELDTLGYILLGSIGEDVPILNWENKRPFKVEYVSFSTWTNVKGQWYFACPKNFNREAMDDHNVTTLERLRNDLFTYYNPTIAPQEDDEADRTVEMNLDIKHFRLDEMHATLTLIGVSHLKWRDRKLSWDPKDYDGIDNLPVSSHKVWTPNVKILNSLMITKKSILSLGGGVIILSNGTLHWRSPFYFTTFCALSLKHWPFGIHNCSLDFGFLIDPFKLDIKEMVLPDTNISEWEMNDIMKKTALFDVLPSPNYFVHILVQRRNPAIFRILIVPSYICAMVLSLVSFWMDPRSASKIFLNSGSLSILILTLIGLSERFPRMTCVPELVQFYSKSMLVMCIPIIVFIALKYAPSNIRVPEFLVNFLDSPIVQTILCLPQMKSQTPDFQQEAVFFNISRLFVLADRVIFWIYFTILVVPFLVNMMIYEQMG